MEKGVNEQPKATPGVRFVAVVLACAIIYAMWLARNRSVRLDDSHVAREAKSSITLPDMRIDINAATAAELSLLPGLGPGLAQRVVDDRDTRGPFATIDELERVPGIGGAIIERLRPYAVASPVVGK